MSGEKSVKSGNDGHVIAEKLLTKLGWLPNSNIQYGCALGEKHKTSSSKSERVHHNLDILIQRESPLSHEHHDVILVSVKHIMDKYPSSFTSPLQSHLKDIAQCIECADKYDTLANEDLIIQTSRRNRYYGLIIWLSSNLEEQNYDIMETIIEKGVDEKITTASIRHEFNTIFLLDNKRMTFIYSAYEIAKNYSPTAKLKFFYHDTGTNINAADLTNSDDFLPMELMFSNILPIILQEENKSSILIFCNDNFDKTYLKRVIWFIIKNNMGFSSEIFIYFKNYDTTIHSQLVESAKNIFIQDKDVVHKIHVKKFDSSSFTRLKEATTNTYDTTSFIKSEPKKQNIRNDFESNIDNILPYGNMLIPMVSSSLLSAKDLKDFLTKKGIITKGSEKETLVPIFANLLLTPNEIDELRSKLIDKEDKQKNAPPYFSEWKDTNTSLDNAMKDIDLSAIKPTQNCKILEPIPLKFKRVSSNYYELNIKIERTNTTKDLLSGVTRHECSVSVILNKNTLRIKSEYTALETKKMNDKIVTYLSEYFKKNNFIISHIKGVHFGDFTNPNRVNFIMALHNDIAKLAEVFSQSSVQNIKFKPDDTIAKLPQDLEIMKGKVSNLNITGDNLDKLTYLKDFKDVILLERIKIQVSFVIDGNNGICDIEIGFPSALNSRKKVDNDAELQTVIDIVNSRKNNITISHSKLQRSISKRLDTFLYENFDTFSIKR